jgi:hypothetical protein
MLVVRRAQERERERERLPARGKMGYDFDLERD